MGLVGMPRDQLRGFERVAVPLLERLNGSQRARRLMYATTGKFNAWWIDQLIGPLWQVRGQEHLHALRPKSGVIVVSNHRSFFDFYYLGTILVRRTGLVAEVTFPVRSPFFYTSPLGMAVNLAISGGTMWPPVFRDERKRQLNPLGLQQVAWSLGPGTMMGIHPEGTRGKGPNPYEFLPLKPGFGQLLPLLAADVTIVPALCIGASSSVLHEMRRARKPHGQRGEAVRLHFGPSMTVAEVMQMGQRDGQFDPMLATERVFDGVRKLADDDRREFAG
jgi:1-acyl-sn-glycerol-3-phosphate acyltransferase